MRKQDNECFRWCHIRHLNPFKNNAHRITKDEFASQLKYDKINFPVKLNQVNKIEKQNSISINIFGYENKHPFPLYISKEKYDNHMDLLLITETKHKERKHFCMYCLQCFSSEQIL